MFNGFSDSPFKIGVSCLKRCKHAGHGRYGQLAGARKGAHARESLGGLRRLPSN